MSTSAITSPAAPRWNTRRGSAPTKSSTPTAAGATLSPRAEPDARQQGPPPGCDRPALCAPATVSSMLEQELGVIQQGPEQVLGRPPTVVGPVGEFGHGQRALRLAGRA